MNFTKPERKPAQNRDYRVLYVTDVMAILDIGQSNAYKLIRKLNDEIEAAGFIRPQGGRISERYFRERLYLGDTEIPPPEGGGRAQV